MNTRASNRQATFTDYKNAYNTIQAIRNRVQHSEFKEGSQLDEQAKVLITFCNQTLHTIQDDIRQHYGDSAANEFIKDAFQNPMSRHAIPRQASNVPDNDHFFHDTALSITEQIPHAVLQRMTGYRESDTKEALLNPDAFAARVFLENKLLSDYSFNERLSRYNAARSALEIENANSDRKNAARTFKNSAGETKHKRSFTANEAYGQLPTSKPSYDDLEDMRRSVQHTITSQAALLPINDSQKQQIAAACFHHITSQHELDAFRIATQSAGTEIFPSGKAWESEHIERDSIVVPQLIANLTAQQDKNSRILKNGNPTACPDYEMDAAADLYALIQHVQQKKVAAYRPVNLESQKSLAAYIHSRSHIKHHDTDDYLQSSAETLLHNIQAEDLQEHLTPTQQQLLSQHKLKECALNYYATQFLKRGEFENPEKNMPENLPNAWHNILKTLEIIETIQATIDASQQTQLHTTQALQELRGKAQKQESLLALVIAEHCVLPEHLMLQGVEGLRETRKKDLQRQEHLISQELANTTKQLAKARQYFERTQRDIQLMGLDDTFSKLLESFKDSPSSPQR